MDSTMKKRWISLFVENQVGVLPKISGLFSGKLYNLDSLTVGPTEDPTVSRMTIVSSGDKAILEQVEKQLNKKLDIIKVKTFDEPSSISRELMLIKVKYNKSNRRDIIENCEIMKAQIVDMSRSYMMIQICDVPERSQLLLSMLRGISIVEVARTGTLALTKCIENENGGK